MQRFFDKIDIKVFLFGIGLILWISSCVPVRQQIFFRDKNLLTLGQIQSMDTTVKVFPYVYKIRKGDVLSVNITTLIPSSYSFAPALQTETEEGSGYIVNDSGYVDLPILGLLKVEGQSLIECRKYIKNVASDFMNNVMVNVKLLNFKVSIIGEKSMIITSPDGNLTLIQAIAQIVVLTEFTNLEKVRVIR